MAHGRFRNIKSRINLNRSEIRYVWKIRMHLLHKYSIQDSGTLRTYYTVEHTLTYLTFCISCNLVCNVRSCFIPTYLLNSDIHSSVFFCDIPSDILYCRYELFNMLFLQCSLLCIVHGKYYTMFLVQYSSPWKIMAGREHVLEYWTGA